MAKVRSIKEKFGMLSEPSSEKIQKVQMTNIDKQRIIDMYSFIPPMKSRQLPGMKNVKSVKQLDEKRLRIKKALLLRLLVNINELHTDYKKKFKDGGWCEIIWHFRIC